jgi:hypothetical protein
MPVLQELLKAKTQEELESLAMAWTDRMTNAQWALEQGYSQKQVKQTKDGYEISMSVKRVDPRIVS